MAMYASWDDGLLAEALAEPFPAECVKQLTKGGAKIDFVPWHFYVARLNALVGPEGWSMGVPVMHEVGGKLVIGLPVLVLGVQKINFGTEAEEKDDYGDAATNAWAQAFKRTMALFGMGLSMYDKDRRNARRQAPAPRPQPAANGNALVSEAQLTRLHTIAQKAGWTGAAFKHYLTGLGYASSKDIPRNAYDGIVQAVQNPEVKARTVAEMAQAGAGV